MSKLLSIIGYICLVLAILAVIVQLLPFGMVSDIILWVSSLFLSGEGEHMYIKIVPAAFESSPVVILLTVGLVFVLLARIIKNKVNIN